MYIIYTVCVVHHNCSVWEVVNVTACWLLMEVSYEGSLNETAYPAPSTCTVTCHCMYNVRTTWNSIHSPEAQYTAIALYWRL